MDLLDRWAGTDLPSLIRALGGNQEAFYRELLVTGKTRFALKLRFCC